MLLKNMAKQVKKNKIFIFPGWGQNLDDYKKVISVFSDRYEVGKFEWNTMNEKYSLGGEESALGMVDNICSQIHMDTNDIIIGFSIGAIIANMVAFKKNAKKVILCSYPNISFEIKNLPREQMSDITDQQLQEIKDILPIKGSMLLYGDGESEDLKELSLKFGGVEVNDTGHELSNNYIDAIISAVEKL